MDGSSLHFDWYFVLPFLVCLVRLGHIMLSSEINSHPVCGLTLIFIVRVDNDLVFYCAGSFGEIIHVELAIDGAVSSYEFLSAGLQSCLLSYLLIVLC